MKHPPPRSRWQCRIVTELRRRYRLHDVPPIMLKRRQCLLCYGVIRDLLVAKPLVGKESVDRWNLKEDHEMLSGPGFLGLRIWNRYWTRCPVITGARLPRQWTLRRPKGKPAQLHLLILYAKRIVNLKKDQNSKWSRIYHIQTLDVMKPYTGGTVWRGVALYTNNYIVACDDHQIRLHQKHLCQSKRQHGAP